MWCLSRGMLVRVLLTAAILVASGCGTSEAPPGARPHTYHGLHMVVLEGWGVQQGLRRWAVTDPAGVEAVRRWLDVNRPWDLNSQTGAVMPAYCIILLSERGQKDMVAVYSTLDSTGRRAHSVEALQRLESVFHEYGSPYDGPVGSGWWPRVQGRG